MLHADPSPPCDEPLIFFSIEAEDPAPVDYEDRSAQQVGILQDEANGFLSIGWLLFEITLSIKPIPWIEENRHIHPLQQLPQLFFAERFLVVHADVEFSPLFEQETSCLTTCRSRALAVESEFPVTHASLPSQ